MLSVIPPVAFDVHGSAAAKPHQASGEDVADLLEVGWEVAIDRDAGHTSTYWGAGRCVGLVNQYA